MPARFRFHRDALSDGFATTDTVASRAELGAVIRRAVVYLRDMSESDLAIQPSYGRTARSGVLTLTNTYVVRTAYAHYGTIGFLDAPL
jgi:hypothetical protein